MSEGTLAVARSPRYSMSSTDNSLTILPVLRHLFRGVSLSHNLNEEYPVSP